MAPAPRDIYKNDVDFTALALQYPAFAKKYSRLSVQPWIQVLTAPRLKPNRQLDFSDPESVCQLTKCLLHRDFDISIELPTDRLCPPVPNRFNYILWLQDLIDCTSHEYRHTYDPNRRVLGLDIGTGASCIYPLLGCRQRPQWNFVATEIDDKSRKFAESNIKLNGLTDRIKILSDVAEDRSALLPMVWLQDRDHVDFVMTNPPFYASQAEMLESAKKKQRPPASACTGAPIEMITPGGEVQFVSRLILESLEPEIGTTVQWFSSMLGKFGSIDTIVERLKSKGCNNYAVTEFIQGQKTRRWAVAWSWQHLRPTPEVARGISGCDRKMLPFPSVFETTIEHGSASEVDTKINICMKGFGPEWQWKPQLHAGMFRTWSDVWSRKARRRQLKHEEDGDRDFDDEDEFRPPYRFIVSAVSTPGESGMKVRIRWVQGQEVVLYESFCGWLKRKLEHPDG